MMFLYRPTSGIFLIVFVLLSTVSVAQVEPPQVERVLEDSWYVKLSNGEEDGWMHERIVATGEGEYLHYRTSYESFDRTCRFGQVSLSRVQGWSLEDHQGHLLEMHDRSEDSGEVTLYDLNVYGAEAKLVTTTLGVARERTLPWVDDVLGNGGLRLLALRHGLKAGVTYSFNTFEFSMGIINNTRRIIGVEEVELLDGESRTAWHIVETCSGLPGIQMNTWRDETSYAVKYEVDVAGLVFNQILTSEVRAKKNESTSLQVDTFEIFRIPCEVNIPSLVAVDSILYRLMGKDASLGVSKTLEDDARQTVLEDDGQTTTLLVKELVPPTGQKIVREDLGEAFSEYLDPNHLIQSDHPALRAKALEVAGKRTEAWEVACLLEQFVHNHIVNIDCSVGYVSAGQVFETRTGDCTEHALLLAAMARAVGLPSRVASGFVYGESAFNAHAWTEIWISGAWYALDATRPEGRVGPGHIRFTADSHQNETSSENFLATLQGLNLDVEIVEFTCGKRKFNAENGFKTAFMDGNTYRNILFGIRLVKPSEHEAVIYDDESFAENAMLTLLAGTPMIFLMAMPLQTDEAYQEGMEEEGFKLISELPQRICGRKGIALMVEKQGVLYCFLCFSNDTTTFVLWTILRDEERDLPVFMDVVQSIVLD